MKRRRIFCHGDLDGISTVVLSKLTMETDYSYHGYQTINEKVMEFINEEKNNEIYSEILITDISLNEETAELIDSIKDLKNYSIKLIDHHKTAEHLIKYDWCTIKNETEKHKHSGTELTYEYLLKLHPENKCLTSSATKEFVELVRRWDTWDWTILNDKKASDLSTLTNMYTFPKFITLFTDKLLNKKELFNEQDLLLIEIKDREYESAKKHQIKNMFINKEYNFGLIQAGEYTSVMCNDIAKEFPNLDYIVSFSFDKGLSIRTIHDDKDCIEFANKLADLTNSLRGGHTKASGVSIDKNKMKQTINDFITGKFEND